MKSLLQLTASGPLLILTSHESLADQKLLEVLRQEGIGKFVAFEVPLSRARARYGVAVESICMVPRALVARATASSPSGWKDFSPPVGHVKIGLL